MSNGSEFENFGGYDGLDEFSNPISREPSPYERPVPHHPKSMGGSGTVRQTPQNARPYSQGSPQRQGGGQARGDGQARRSGSSSYRRGKRSHYVKASPLFSMLFFPCAIFYHEVLLRLFNKDVSFFGLPLLCILLFSLAGGLVVFLILDLIPNKRVSRWIGGILMMAFIVLLCVQQGMVNVFRMYYGIFAMAETAGDAVTNFADNFAGAVVGLLPFICLSLIPLVLFIWLRDRVLYERGQEWLARGLILVILIVAQLGGHMFASIGENKAYYTYNFTTNNGITHFGLLTSARLELQYTLFGMPEEDLDQYKEENPSGPDSQDGPDDPNKPDDPPDDNPDNPPEGPDNPDTPPDTPPEPPKTYGPNVIDSVDFSALAAGASGKLKDMDEYFGSLTPTMENEYTGMFKDKNLILLTAEGFCPYAIDEELTPTLYRLTHEAFVFNNFYQPDWTLSTVGGEFSVTTGVIPNWVSSSNSARASIGNAMPTTLGNMFKAIGYSTPAWHNGDYTYYKRNQYLATYGYDYKGENGGGLDLPTDNWPRSDYEMIVATCDQYIDDYVNNGQKFHAYYMTISGHGNYTFSYNHRSAQYKDLVVAKYPNLSEPCQAYLACNIDLDRALEYLVKKLEDAGIADDTLIVMCADHFPYMLAYGNSNDPSTGDGTDYYNELTKAITGHTDTLAVTSRYRNTLLMWSACIEEPIVVDTPCYSCDIVPTIANLFGLDYDSRLYSGRDIFATNWEVDEYSSSMPLVIFADSTPMRGNSWITPAGTYESSTKTFTPNPGVTVDDDYVAKVKKLVSGKIAYSKLIISQNYYKHVFG